MILHNFYICILIAQVRVFTYLIGREVTFAKNVKWIACNNKGAVCEQLTHYAHHTSTAIMHSGTEISLELAH